ncbi:MAG: ATP-binding protein [Treponema sp.]|nr:ATP-binding protein [Treponema sp.]
MSEDIIEAFASETREILDGMETAIAELEAGGEGAIDALFRYIHTIKGSAGIVGLPRLEAFAHAWETRLGKVRQGQARFGPSSFGALDACRSHVASLIDAARPSVGAASIAPDREATESDERALAALDATMTTPRVDATERIKALREKARGVAVAAQGQTAVADAMARVPASKLEKIQGYSGEIVVALSNFTRSARAAGSTGLNYELAAIESLAASLYRTVLEARMIPFGEIAGRFARAVEEISRDRGTKIRFVLAGAETEIDKSLADRLVEPLLHLVRNAADHGIEKPEARIAAGKNPEGLIALRARRESGSLTIRIEDDGVGIDPNLIRAAAVKRGRIGDEERPDDGELFDLLFEAGFSLSAEVTRWSGRGVGLDVVKKSVGAMRGTVRIESKPGEGSTAIVRLPLALSLVEGFVARAGGLDLLIPFDATQACFEFAEEGRADSPWRTVPWTGRLLPAIDLGALYDEGGSGPGGTGDGARRVAVVLEDSGSRTALIVDEVGETLSAAVRPLDRALADSPGIAGSAILGDGSMVLVLDTAELVLMAQRGRRSIPQR